MIRFLLLSLALPLSGLAHPAADHRIEALSAAIAAEPSAALLVRRAREYLQAGQLALAGVDLEEAAHLDPRSAGADLARWHLANGEAELALEQANRHLASFPGDRRAYKVRAEIRVQLGAPSAAAEDLLHYLDGMQAQPGEYLAAATLLADINRPGDALALLDRALDEVGDSTPLLRRAAALQVSMGDVTGAISYWQRLEPVMSESPGWCMELASLYLEGGDSGSAGTWLDKAQALIGEQKKTPASERLTEEINRLRSRIIDPVALKPAP